MNPNLDALRLQMERKQIAHRVNDFFQDCEAILAMNENRAIPWRIQALAEIGFLDNVELSRKCGYLLYLHDACTLKKGT